MNNLLEFPCDFPIKIIGLADKTLLIETTNLLYKLCPKLNAASISSRLSKNGKYLAVTAILFAESKQQLDAIYRALTSDQRIKMVL